MQVISESSLLSDPVTDPVSIPQSTISHLHSIETCVFQRVTNLRNLKIKLMEKLSGCVDDRNLAENHLFQAIASQMAKHDQLANQSECREAIMKHFELKQEEQELKSRMDPDHLPAQQQEEELLEKIVKQRAHNEELEEKLRMQRHRTPIIHKQLSEFRKNMEQLHLQASKEEQTIKTKQDNGGASLSELLEYVEEEQNNKRKLYEDLVEFQREIEELRAENEVLSSRSI